MGRQFYLSLLIGCVVFWHGISATFDRKRKNEEESSLSSSRSRRRITSHPENPTMLALNSHPNLNRPSHLHQNLPQNIYKLEIAVPTRVVVAVDESKVRLGYAINPFIVVTFAEFLQGYKSVLVFSCDPRSGQDIPHNVINVKISGHYNKNNELYDVAVLEVKEAIAFEQPVAGVLQANVFFSSVAIEFASTMAKELLEMRLGPEVQPYHH